MTKELVMQPISLDPFFKEAQSFITNIKDTVPLSSAILDDWNPEGIKGPRIIYGAKYLEICSSNCSNCLLYQTVGEESETNSSTFQESKIELHSKLFRPKTGQPSKRTYANCRTLEDYQEAFINFIVDGCKDPDLFKVELLWVKGFRILMLDNGMDISVLTKKENESKTHIFESVNRELEIISDLQRIIILDKFRKQNGFI